MIVFFPCEVWPVIWADKEICVPPCTWSSDFTFHLSLKWIIEGLELSTAVLIIKYKEECLGIQFDKKPTWTRNIRTIYG